MFIVLIRRTCLEFHENILNSHQASSSKNEWQLFFTDDLVTSYCQGLQAQGGNLKKFEQGGSVYFFGSEIWLKFTFLGEKKYNYFFGLQIFEIIFLGSLKVTKFIFLNLF